MCTMRNTFWVCTHQKRKPKTPLLVRSVVGEVIIVVTFITLYWDKRDLGNGKLGSVVKASQNLLIARPVLRKRLYPVNKFFS